MRRNCELPTTIAVSWIIALYLCVSQGVAQDRQTDGPDIPTDAVWIYRDVPPQNTPDKRSEPERLFTPFGFWPSSKTTQITVNAEKPVDKADRSKGTCIEYYFEFQNRDDYMGVYHLIEGNCWGTKPGINVPRLLGVPPETPVLVRLRARGEGVVTFKIGGVNEGAHPSSLRLPVAADPSPTWLTPEFREVTIGPILAGKLANVVDPLCVGTTTMDNPRREFVRAEVDDIRIEPLTRQRTGATLPEGWRGRLTRTLFMTYTPRGFDPTAKPVKKPTPEAIRADLAAIRASADRAGIVGDRVGIITYGCRDGLEQVPSLAQEAKLSVLLGIFNPRDTDEVRNAEVNLKRANLRHTIVGCCVGNEAITFRRATLEDIQKVMRRLSRARRVPMTTTEVVQSYGNKKLFQFDFTLLNAHAIFSEVFAPEQGDTLGC